MGSKRIAARPGASLRGVAFAWTRDRYDPSVAGGAAAPDAAAPEEPDRTPGMLALWRALFYSLMCAQWYRGHIAHYVVDYPPEAGRATGADAFFAYDQWEGLVATLPRTAAGVQRLKDALAQTTRFTNHDYLFSLLLLLTAVSGAGGAWSVDAACRRARARVPGAAASPARRRAAVVALRAQLAVVYVFASLWKTHPDWVSGALVRGIFLGFEEQGVHRGVPWAAMEATLGPRLFAAVALGGLLLDGSMAAALLRRRADAPLEQMQIVGTRRALMGVYPRSWLKVGAGIGRAIQHAVPEGHAVAVAGCVDIDHCPLSNLARLPLAAAAARRAGHGRDMPNFKGSALGGVHSFRLILDERPSLGARSKRGRSFRSARARNARVEAASNRPRPAQVLAAPPSATVTLVACHSNGECDETALGPTPTAAFDVVAAELRLRGPATGACKDASEDAPPRAEALWRAAAGRRVAAPRRPSALASPRRAARASSAPRARRRRSAS
ncbi:hypothetical protein SO694_00018462 [Aureococcus anophagefferens]|uniref:HTTM domain-containing protein n=1 Tax=Aureococcus anophagefferens TaxID=44056 RepID=A0ABR1G0M4_AURAN